MIIHDQKLYGLKGLLLLRAFELGSSAVGGASNPAALELSIDTAWKD